METEIDIDFTRKLPKAELHAHLSGSISRDTLHEIWQMKRSKGECLDLPNPLTTIKTGEDGFVDVATFFPLFDKYVYALCNDLESVRYATERVVRDFEADGVRYLELRTTPRVFLEHDMGMHDYVAAVNDTISRWNNTARGEMLEVYLILSIDRRMTAEQAAEILDLAIEYRYNPGSKDQYVVAIDMCGNPAQGDVSIFTETFQRARECGLGITVHFAEVPQSATDRELTTILSWNPDRLGHCIHVAQKFKHVIRRRSLGLELCLSCNVLAGLTSGGIENHHFNHWLGKECPIALSTDDVGVFGSALSNEYFLAWRHFLSSREDVVELSRQAVRVAFAGRQRMMRLIEEFEVSMLS